jgi:hypothetical protein
VKTDIAYVKTSATPYHSALVTTGKTLIPGNTAMRISNLAKPSRFIKPGTTVWKEKLMARNYNMFLFPYIITTISIHY